MTAHTAIAAQDVVAESPLAKLLRLMKRARSRAESRDSGSWIGIGQVKQMFGTKDADLIRGLLIKLVASGDVEVIKCSNGIYWRAYSKPQPVKPHPYEAVDGRFVLQRQNFRHGIEGWSDSKTFTNRLQAQAALADAQAYNEREYRDWGNIMPPVRLLSVEEI